jgi:hypothetical protein
VTRRAAAVGLVLFAAYAATLGLDAFGASDYGGDEPHYLLAAKSVIDDGDLDVRDEYRDRSFAGFYPHELDRHGVETGGRLHEPHGAGLPLLIAPAHALGGEIGVELFLAGLLALAGALAYGLARRVAPDPWAWGATLAVGLSAPLLSYGTAVYPEGAAAAALAGAALLALRLEDGVTRRGAIGCFALLALLPWLGVKFLPAAVVIGYAAARALWRARRRVLALVGVEVVGFSLALLVRINLVLYEGATPYAAGLPGETGTGAGSAGDYLERAYRLIALLIDRDYGLLRWAPVLALAGVGLWMLIRARKEHLVRAIPTRRAAESAAGLCAAALGAQLVVAAFLAPTMFGFWFPGRQLVAALPLAIPLVAWGLRRLPRLGTALALVGVAASAWLHLDVRLGDGGLAAGRPDVPLGPLTGALPLFDRSTLPYVVAAALGIAVAVLLALGARQPREPARVPG